MSLMEGKIVQLICSHFDPRIFHFNLIDNFVGLALNEDTSRFMDAFLNSISEDFGYDLEDGFSFWGQHQIAEPPRQSVVQRDECFILKGIIKVKDNSVNEVAYMHFELLFKL
jgi:hypothetical protein